MKNSFVQQTQRDFAVAGLVALGLTFAACGLARAGDCSAQRGKPLFEDNFATGAHFQPDDQAKFGPNGLEMTVGKGEDAWAYITTAAQATDGDYCAVATMPAPLSAENGAAVGLVLLQADDDDVVTLYVFSDNTVQIEVRSRAKDPQLVLNEQNPAVKAEIGSPVSVRAVVQNGMVTATVNGIAFKPVPVQTQPTGNHFGLYARLDQEADRDAVFSFKSLRVTDGK